MAPIKTATGELPLSDEPGLFRLLRFSRTPRRRRASHKRCNNSALRPSRPFQLGQTLSQESERTATPPATPPKPVRFLSNTFEEKTQHGHRYNCPARVALSGVPLGALTLGVYTTATICGASGGSYHCHPDHAYGEESDKSEESPSPKRQRLSSQSVLEQLTSSAPPTVHPISPHPPLGVRTPKSETTSPPHTLPPGEMPHSRSAQTQPTSEASAWSSIQTHPSLASPSPPLHPRPRTSSVAI
ncbi:E3 ubiquitin-protein ligase RNF38-like protein [Lates japonicus]|uniref:E3 ubiquitin-protein ligase RNF38-like protein n=1 Tax=Lates japonicus TaxID=270547 RepID=A0AAD3RAL8_LATJO|nr:E3 ubiquitin-protein ligase RNF38-like protein [Lates japonicus]